MIHFNAIVMSSLHDSLSSNSAKIVLPRLAGPNLPFGFDVSTVLELSGGIDSKLPVFSSFPDCVSPLLGSYFMNKISSDISVTFVDTVSRKGNDKTERERKVTENPVNPRCKLFK
jgi:hypothetical protein